MKILIIDDEKNICTAVRDILDDEGYQPDFSLTWQDGLNKLKTSSFDVVFLDIWLPDIDGLEALKVIKRLFPTIEVVIISGHGTIETAVDAIHLGAYDYLQKPLSLDRITVLTKRLHDMINMRKDLQQSKINAVKKYDIIGKSQIINDLRNKIIKIASTNSWVFITGEKGVGKKHAARLIHMLSKNAEKPFININCSAKPEEFVEFEIFGKNLDKLKLINDNDLFLNEIDELSQTLQAKLLQFFETGEIVLADGKNIVQSNYRLITATSKNLQDEIKANRFMSDLYSRINIVSINIPALRDRREDIPMLMSYFIENISNQNNIEIKPVSEDLMNSFINYDWPGNVGELKNAIERMVTLNESNIYTGELKNLLKN